MVWDIIRAAVTMDISALMRIALANILWVFIFFALAYIFFEGKSPLRAFIHIFLAALFFAQLVPFLGWKEYTAASFLAFYYIIDFSLLKWAETTPFFANRLVWVEEFTFFGSLIFFNLLA